MIKRPDNMNAYEFSVLSALRAKQLIMGCTPQLAGNYKATTMAQMEVSAGMVPRLDAPAAVATPVPVVLATDPES